MDGIGRNCSLRKTGFHPESSPGQAFSAICSRRIAHTIAAAGLALACAGPLLGQTAAVPIAAMAIGAPPADFEFWRTGQGAPGEWVVVRDATAASGRAIEQASRDRTDYRFPLAVYKPVAAKNAEVTIRFKAISGRIDRAGGIAVRVRTPDDYYVARANALENNVRFYRVIKGRREQLAGADVKVSSNAWHSLSLKAEEARFTVSFDGKTLYTATDAMLSDAGRIALWTKADSVTPFDRIEVKVLP